MSYLEERPVHRTKRPVYEVSLSIYPVEVCGEDLQKGEPVRISDKGEDLYELKKRTNKQMLSSVSGKCFVEMLVTKDGEYFDRDEWWFYKELELNVDGGHYEC